MKTNKTHILVATVAGVLALAVPARAEEGASGHYLPGGAASFIDTLPGREAFGYLNAFAFYDGSASATRQLRLGRNLVADVKGTIYADTSILLYQTPLKLAGGQYAVALAIPYMWMEVKGTVQVGSLLPPGSRRDTANGLGDIQFMPFMLGWTKGDFKLDTRLGIYAPSGDYEPLQLANLGKNFWTFEPGVSVSWFSSKIGTEVSLFAGLDFNTKNSATDYQSGNVFHLDATVAQHLPLGKGFIGLGANAFYYQQFSGDSGGWAVLGDFKGRTVGIGPVLSYIRKVGKKTDLVAELKWLPELDTAHRMKGDIVWFKLGVAF